MRRSRIFRRSRSIRSCSTATVFPTTNPRSLPMRGVARGIDADHSDVSRPRGWDSSVCTGCLRTDHSDATVRLYDATSPGQMVPGHKLPRLDGNGIAPTLRAGSDSTHGSYTAPRPIHPSVPRMHHHPRSRSTARLPGLVCFLPVEVAWDPTDWKCRVPTGGESHRVLDIAHVRTADDAKSSQGGRARATSLPCREIDPGASSESR